jgi:predicted Fe-Mo cluster-binding NifX family protein
MCEKFQTDWPDPCPIKSGGGGSEFCHQAVLQQKPIKKGNFEQKEARMKVAIPRFGESVAPCFEYCATMAIFIIEGGEIREQVDVPLHSRVPFDRIRLLREHRVDAVICGGVEDIYEDMLREHGFEVVSWVEGKVENLLREYLAGRLVAGAARLGRQPEGENDGMDKTN